MAERNERGQFKTGYHGGGRKPLPADVMAARNMDYEKFCLAIIEIRNATPNTVKKINLNDEAFAKRAILNAYVKLDYKAINNYENRLFGKPKEIIELDASDEIKDNILGEIIGECREWRKKLNNE